jgi:TPR repeat protein
LILVALLLAVGMGYLRWRNQGFGWLGASSKKPSASQTEDGSTPPPSNSPTDNSTAANPSAAPSQPAPDASASSNPPSLAPANGTAPASSSSAATPNPPAAANPAPATPSSDAPAKPSSKPSADPKDKDKDEDADADEPDANQPPVPRPKPAAVKAPKPVDPVSEAEKYLYGKGAPQNCDRGMKLLRPAADRGNPKAMSEMGALYSAGLCAPKDLPTAYHWFALALRKTPDDRAVQADMQKVWGEMTQPERQLAIRQSQ